MRMKLFLVFHLEKCFEEVQHCTAYFIKIQLSCCFPYMTTLVTQDCPANFWKNDVFFQFLTLKSNSGYYPWTMCPRK